MRDTPRRPNPGDETNESPGIPKASQDNRTGDAAQDKRGQQPGEAEPENKQPDPAREPLRRPGAARGVDPNDLQSLLDYRDERARAESRLDRAKQLEYDDRRHRTNVPEPDEPSSASPAPSGHSRRQDATPGDGRPRQPGDPTTGDNRGAEPLHRPAAARPVDPKDLQSLLDYRNERSRVMAPLEQAKRLEYEDRRRFRTPEPDDPQPRGDITTDGGKSGPSPERADGVLEPELDGVLSAASRAIDPADTRSPGASDADDDPRETTVTVDRPEFEDPNDPGLADRYGKPLDGPDGTRTPLFDGAPKREETRQGNLNDCGVIATLGAAAGHRPDAVRDLISTNQDDSYQVRLHACRYVRGGYEPTGERIDLTVTADLPIQDHRAYAPAFANSGHTHTAWAPVLEKAIAGIDQAWTDDRRAEWHRDWDRQAYLDALPADPRPEGYVRLNQGADVWDQAELLTQLTGQAAEVRDTADRIRGGPSPEKRTVDEFRRLLSDQKPILVHSKELDSDDGPLAKGLIDGHAYEVIEVDESDQIHLRNPWNMDHPEPLTFKEFRDHFRSSYTTLR